MSDTQKTKLGDAIFGSIDDNDFLNVLYDNMLYNYAILKLHLEGFQQARQVDVEAALRFADLLSKSTHPTKSDDHKMWAQAIITLLLELEPENEDVAYYTGSVLSSIGNFRGTEIAKTVYKSGYTETTLQEKAFATFISDYLSVPAQKDILSRVNERLTNDYFDITLLGSEGLAVSGRGNNAWNAYVASLNIMDAKILFSKSSLLVSKLFEPGTDGNRRSLEKHHLFPKAYLKSLGYPDSKINQMANYAFIDWKDNMDILDDAPSVYYPIVCEGKSEDEIRRMEEENALPHGWENMAYEDFLEERRKLMAAKIKAAYEQLKKNVE